MIDYDTPDEDPIIAEVRRAREEIAAEIKYALRLIMEEAMRRQSSTGRTYATPAANPAPEPATKVG